jgi:hypothetical protein
MSEQIEDKEPTKRVRALQAYDRTIAALKKRP